MLRRLQELRQRAVAALHELHEFSVGGAAPLPAHQYLIPRDRAVLQQPALVLLVEGGGEGAIYHPLLARLVEVRRDAEAKLLAEWYGGAHPRLAQLVVALTLEAEAKLLRMLFQVVGQAEPLDGQQEHPVNRLLQPLVLGGIGRELAHPLLAVAQVEGLFLIHLDQRALPRPE